jgi:hypothetical protein
MSGSFFSQNGCNAATANGNTNQGIMGYGYPSLALVTTGTAPIETIVPAHTLIFCFSSQVHDGFSCVMHCVFHGVFLASHTAILCSIRSS